MEGHDAEKHLEDEIENKLAQQRAMEREHRLREAFQSFDAAQEGVDQRSEELARAEADLTAALIDAAIEWLAAKWGHETPCPYCGNPEWTVSLPFNILLESRETLPAHFSAVCTNCGNTVLINAVMAGLLPGLREQGEQ